MMDYVAVHWILPYSHGAVASFAYQCGVCKQMFSYEDRSLMMNLHLHWQDTTSQQVATVAGMNDIQDWQTASESIGLNVVSFLWWGIGHTLGKLNYV